MKKKYDPSHNVELLIGIEGKARRYKHKLVIPMSTVGIMWDNVEGGKPGGQGGLVFDNEELALKLLNTLQIYFKKNKITTTKEVYSWFYDKVRFLFR